MIVESVFVCVLKRYVMIDMMCSDLLPYDGTIDVIFMLTNSE